MAGLFRQAATVPVLAGEREPGTTREEAMSWTDGLFLVEVSCAFRR